MGLDDIESNRRCVAAGLSDLRAPPKDPTQPPAALRGLEMTKTLSVAERSVQTGAGDILFVPIALAAFWTVAYQLVLVARWPAQTIVWCFLAIAFAGLFL